MFQTRSIQISLAESQQHIFPHKKFCDFFAQVDCNPLLRDNKTLKHLLDNVKYFHVLKNRQHEIDLNFVPRRGMGFERGTCTVFLSHYSSGQIKLNDHEQQPTPLRLSLTAQAFLKTSCTTDKTNFSCQESSSWPIHTVKMRPRNSTAWSYWCPEPEPFITFVNYLRVYTCQVRVTQNYWSRRRVVSYRRYFSPKW